jgi:hypothetical protein
MCITATIKFLNLLQPGFRAFDSTRQRFRYFTGPDLEPDKYGYRLVDMSYIVKHNEDGKLKEQEESEYVSIVKLEPLRPALGREESAKSNAASHFGITDDISIRSTDEYSLNSGKYEASYSGSTVASPMTNLKPSSRDYSRTAATLSRITTGRSIKSEQDIDRLTSLCTVLRQYCKEQARWIEIIEEQCSV